MSQHGKPRFRSNLIVLSVEQRKQASHQKVTCFGPLAREQGVPHWERAVARKPLAGLCWFQGETREGRVKGSFLRGVTGTQSIRVCMCKWMWDTRLTSSHASSSEGTGSLKSRNDIPQSVDVEWRREACDWCVVERELTAEDNTEENEGVLIQQCFDSCRAEQGLGQERPHTEQSTGESWMRLENKTEENKTSFYNPFWQGRGESMKERTKSLETWKLWAFLTELLTELEYGLRCTKSRCGWFIPSKSN